MSSGDYGWSSTDAPRSNPGDYFEATFSAQAWTFYRVWLRMRATGDSKWNDSVWVQFTDAVTDSGNPVYRIGSSSALLMNLEPCGGCGVSAWGWVSGTWWMPQETAIRFTTDGTKTVRIQTREDGVEIDQIVLSPSTYLDGAPGSSSNDGTILSPSGSGGSGGGSSAGGGSAGEQWKAKYGTSGAVKVTGCSETSPGQYSYRYTFADQSGSGSAAGWMLEDNAIDGMTISLPGASFFYAFTNPGAFAAACL